MPINIYKKRTADAPASKSASSVENPLSGGMPSLVEGASRKDLPEAMRQKMENAFGADFSNLNIYESEKVAEGGAKAVTQGNTIAFAPGEFNVYSPSSEALLGHELSHVVSQARGESRGSGLVDNAYLEAKADREGVMAAAGQTVYNGPLTPLSGSSPMSVAGPMQCKKKNESGKSLETVTREGIEEQNALKSNSNNKYGGDIDALFQMESTLFGKQNSGIDQSNDEQSIVYDKLINEILDKHKGSKSFMENFSDTGKSYALQMISPFSAGANTGFWSDFTNKNDASIKKNKDRPLIADDEILSRQDDFDMQAYVKYQAFRSLEKKMLDPNKKRGRKNRDLYDKIIGKDDSAQPKKTAPNPMFGTKIDPHKKLSFGEATSNADYIINLCSDHLKQQMGNYHSNDSNNLQTSLHKATMNAKKHAEQNNQAFDEDKFIRDFIDDKITDTI